MYSYRKRKSPRQEVPPANTTSLELKLLKHHTISIEFSLCCTPLGVFNAIVNTATLVKLPHLYGYNL